MRAFKGHGPTVELGPFLHPVSIETLDSTAYEGARGGIIAVEPADTAELERVLVSIRAEKGGSIERGNPRWNPERLKSSPGQPTKYDEADLLEMLGEQRLNSKEWSSLCREERGSSRGKFFELLKALDGAKKVHKSHVDRKWERIHPKSRNSKDENDQ